MRILVTGATGRIGTHLVQELLRAGHTIRALVMPDDASPIPDSVEAVTGKLSDTAALVAAADRVDAVFHLAGALTSRGHTEADFVESNLRGTFNLLTAVREKARDLRRFIFASSDAVYFQGQNQDARFLPVDEIHPKLAGSVYGATKIGAEEMCWAFHRSCSMPVSVLRFGATADAGELIDPTSVFARWLFLKAMIDSIASDTSIARRESLKILQSLDDGEDRLIVVADVDGNPEIRQWADARDIARGCLLALESTEAVGETCNLGGADAFSTAEFVPFLADCLKVPAVKACLPIARRPWYLSSEKARHILGYKPEHSVYDMVKEAIQG